MGKPTGSLTNRKVFGRRSHMAIDGPLSANNNSPLKAGTFYLVFKEHRSGVNDCEDNNDPLQSVKPCGFVRPARTERLG